MEQTNILNSTSTKFEELLEEKIRNLNSIILHNDDVNSFDHVIESLVEICNHDPFQAEQCAWIIHHNGKCDVKNGSFEELVPLRNALCDRGLSAEIK